MSAALAEQVENVLRERVRPELSSHAGSIRLSRIEDGTVHLELVASCAACYFRRGCVVGVVRPALHQHVGSDLRVVVDNARI